MKQNLSKNTAGPPCSLRKIASGFVLVAAFCGCATGNCRQNAKAAAEGAPQTAAGTPASQPGTPSPAVADAKAKNAAVSSGASAGSADAGEKMTVFKYDGSVQCEKGIGISVDEMASALTNAGIKVFTSAKKPDGMLRPQMCGQPTGMANTYSIGASQLKDAEKIGFKQWKF